MQKKQQKEQWSKKEITFVLSKYKQGWSRKEIARAYNDKYFGELPVRTPDSIKHCIDTHGLNITKNVPRVLIVDVETSPILAWVWGLYDQNIPLNMVVKHGSMLSWAAKFAGESKVYYKDMRGKEKDLQDTEELVAPLWDLLDQAEIVIWQNGNKFDYKKINERFIKHKMGRPSRYKTVDTTLLARKEFAFTSNKLEYLAERFGVKYKKLKHKNFPGFSLWDECMKGNKKAWSEIEKYNKYDILCLEEVFLAMAPYAKDKTTAEALKVYNKKK